MNRYLLDTNHVSEAIRPKSELRPKLHEARKNGHILGTCVPALGEIEAGILQTADPDGYRRRLRQLRTQVRLWPLEEPIARQFGEFFIELRRQGKVISQVDLILAALCRHMNLILLSTDTDFDALPDIRREN